MIPLSGASEMPEDRFGDAWGKGVVTVLSVFSFRLPRPGGGQVREGAIARMKPSLAPKLEIRQLKKSFGGHVVLDGVDLSLAAGETTVIMGASGSGKSVTAKCVLGLLPIDGGEIFLDGVELSQLGARKRESLLRQFGVLFQRGALFDSLPVWRNVAFGLMEGLGVGRVAAKAVALEKLAQVGLGSDVAELLPSELSGGMQKRVALARAIAAGPAYLVLDEPTEGLDPIMVDVVDDFVIKTVNELKATTLAITNNIACARKIATRVAMLHEGKIIWNGAVGELDRSGNSYVERFIHGHGRLASG